MPQSATEKLHAAVKKNDVKAIERLIKQGCELNERLAKRDDDSGITALSLAAILSKVPAAEALIKAGADVDARDASPKKPKPNFGYNLRTPLLYASTAGSPEIVQMLLDAGADAKVTEDWGTNGLYSAIMGCDGKPHFKVIEILVKAGLKLTQPATRKDSAYISLAADKDPYLYKRGLIKTLVDCGANPNVVDKRDKCRPLHLAVKVGANKSVAELLECGADPSLTAPKSKGHDWSGLTPLEYARKIKAKKSIIELLLNSTAPSKTTSNKSAKKAGAAKQSRPKKLPTPAKAWEQIEATLADQQPPLLKSLQKGATPAQISKLIGKTRIRLTSEVKEFFQRHNGQGGSKGLIVDESSGEQFRLLSVDEVIREWSIWQGLDEAGDFEDAGATADKGVRECWWHAKWLPFAANSAGDFLCFDNSPAKGGKIGQVITLWHESSSRDVAFPSIREMLAEVLDYYSRQ